MTAKVAFEKGNLSCRKVFGHKLSLSLVMLSDLWPYPAYRYYTHSLKVEVSQSHPVMKAFCGMLLDMMVEGGPVGQKIRDAEEGRDPKPAHITTYCTCIIYWLYLKRDQMTASQMWGQIILIAPWWLFCSIGHIALPLCVTRWEMVQT